MLKASLKFIRVRIVVTCYALAFVGSASVGSIGLKTVLALFVIVAWYVHAATGNDYADRDIDRVNLKHESDRPLITNEISNRQLWTTHIAAGILALVLSSFYGPVALIAMVAMLLTDYLYSLKPARLSDRGIVSQLVLAIGYVFYPFSLGYWAVDDASSYPWLLGIGLYLGFVARLLLKDFRDVKGDKLHGKMTFLLRHGARATCTLSGVLWLVSLLVTGVYLSFEVGVMIVLLLGFCQIVWLLKLLAKSRSLQKQISTVALIARVANTGIVTILALLICQKQSNLTSQEIQLVPVIIGLTLLLLNFMRYKDLAKTSQQK